MASARSRFAKALRTLLYGLLYGGMVYLVYLVILPSVLASSGLPVERTGLTSGMLVFLPFFVALESVASAMKGTVYAFVFRVLSKLMGILLFVNVVGQGVLKGTYTLGGVTYTVSLDLGPLIAGVVLLSLPFMLLDVMGFVRRE